MSPYLRHAQTFGNIATSTSAAAGLCIGIHTHSFLLAAACSLAFLAIFSALAAACCYLVARLSPPQDEAMIDHHKVSMPEPRHQNRYCTSTAAGYALPQVLGFIAGLLLTLLFVPALYVIFTAVMGMQEPRW